MAKTIQITFDAADPRALANFWAEALGYVLEAPPEGFASWDEALTAFGVPEELWNSRSAIVDPDGVGPAHLHPAGARAEDGQEPAAPGRPDRGRPGRRQADGGAGGRVRAAGRPRAPPSSTGSSRNPPMENGFITMADPEGNEFCLD